MGLNCGMVGLAGSGKTTLFNSLSKDHEANTQLVGKTNLGQIEVPDPRLDAIAAIIKPAKVVRTTLEIIDIPGITRGGATQKGIGQFLAEIRQTDAIIHVLRCFENPSVPHIEGSINPLRDKETIDLELIAKDLETLEKKMLRIEKLVKVGEKDAKKNLELLTRLRDHFENGEAARSFQFQEDEKPLIDDCFFLTIKPVIYVCNVDEASTVSGNQFTKMVKPTIDQEGAELLIIAAQAEAEIAELDNEEDRIAFLQDIGLEEPGVNKLIRAAYQTLNLYTFFTEDPKEVRAWTIPAGTLAPKAAGVIHSDMERGFIRAEVKRWEDLIELGSEFACKQAGRFRIEGKNYMVQDGDIFHVRFNV